MKTLCVFVQALIIYKNARPVLERSGELMSVASQFGTKSRGWCNPWLYALRPSMTKRGGPRSAPPFDYVLPRLKAQQDSAQGPGFAHLGKE